MRWILDLLGAREGCRCLGSYRSLIRAGSGGCVRGQKEATKRVGFGWVLCIQSRANKVTRCANLQARMVILVCR